MKANLSAVLQRVDAGEQIRVTVRGRHVADLVPAGARPADARLRGLVADGKVALAARPRPRSRPRPVNTGSSATAIVLAERDDGR